LHEENLLATKMIMDNSILSLSRQAYGGHTVKVIASKVKRWRQ